MHATRNCAVMTADFHCAATRADGLNRLTQFVPDAGAAYATGRNTDHGPDQPGAVSRLSSYLRYRLITEQEVFTHVLAQHPAGSAQKFLQEVFWRTYWKGWLEMRPAVWSRYLAECDLQRREFADHSAITAAEEGRTGIDGFDHWARELVETGYLHNHARMWFASIWIFTLRLPWALGADFFLRHLIDADAASNTLSWRWVAGLQTVGKTYLAAADNIARYTNGRFAPVGLAKSAVALTEPPVEAARALPDMAPFVAEQPSLLLVTHEDMHLESLFPANAIIRAIRIAADADLLWGKSARRFVQTAAADTATRTSAYFKCPADISSKLDVHMLIAAAEAAGVRQIITPYAPIGPVADALARVHPVLAENGIALRQVRRSWDNQFWPHALKGYFAFKQSMPDALQDCNLP